MPGFGGLLALKVLQITGFGGLIALKVLQIPAISLFRRVSRFIVF